MKPPDRRRTAGGGCGGGRGVASGLEGAGGRPGTPGMTNAVRRRKPERLRAYFGWPKMPEGLSNIEVSSKNYFSAAIPK